MGEFLPGGGGTSDLQEQTSESSFRFARFCGVRLRRG